MRFHIATGLAAITLLCAQASPAVACSCLATGRLLWPAPGSSGVPLRPNIVVHRSPYVQTNLLLKDAQGRDIALAPQGIGVVNSPGDCGADVAFLKPVSDLDPNTSYTLVFQYPAEASHPRNDIQPVPFVTGTSQESSALVPPLGPTDLRFFRVIEEGNCGTLRCGESVQVVAPPQDPTRPSWLRLTARYLGRDEHTVNFLGSSARQLVSIDPGESCVSYEQIDARGEIIATGKSCTPTGCVRIARLPAGAFYGCSPSAEVPVSVFDHAGANSCDAPPLLVQQHEFAPFRLVQAGETDGGTEDAGAEAQSPAPIIEPVSASTPEDDREPTQIAASTPSHAGARCSLAPSAPPARELLYWLCVALSVLGVRRLRGHTGPRAGSTQTGRKASNR